MYSQKIKRRLNDLLHFSIVVLCLLMYCFNLMEMQQLRHPLFCFCLFSIECVQDVFWGKGCANKCNCTGAHCDHRTGQCTCSAGRIGHNCEQGEYAVYYLNMSLKRVSSSGRIGHDCEQDE